MENTQEISNIEKNKRKFKFDEEKVYTVRKLRNVSIEDFLSLIKEEFDKRLDQSEQNLVKKSNKIYSQRINENHTYTKDDFFLMKEATRVVTLKIPIWIRKNIEIYEKAHVIKSIWAGRNTQNVKGQNHSFDSYE